MLVEALERPDAIEIIERDDGFIAAALCQHYFAPFRRWPARQRRSMRFVRGRMLDVGSGAGRVALHLQERGHEVVAIDVSPGAVEVATRRSVNDGRAMSLLEVTRSRDVGYFDTVAASSSTSRRAAVRIHRQIH